MNPTNFAKHLTNFFAVYLKEQKNASRNTISAYKDAFKLLLKYCQDIRGIAIERIRMDIITAELVKGFLNWIEQDRKCSVATRNQRLAALHSFFRYVQGEDPSAIYAFQKIISIPIKKTGKKALSHLTPEAVKLLLDQPDKCSPKGRRDLTLLSVLYDTAARVQELIDVEIKDIRLDSPAVLLLKGKGNKQRRVPLMKNTATLIQQYLLENDLNAPWKNQYPLFVNSQKRKLTKEGVAYILTKYAKMARAVSPIFISHISPHVLRHAKAMHLLQAGVNLIYIRDYLGHLDLKTTEIYARADTETKRKAIEKAFPEIASGQLPDWNKDKDLLTWLSELK